ncbi:MAG TPA: substrate-binding domain-containing protein, partial [Polyangiaceae bacterium]|nr:substrate-binding domain-containing protein [Polyangiaceae bacterium]
AAGGGAGGAGGRATCDALSARGEVVYVTGSSAAKPFLQQIAQQIASQNAFVVYTSTGSCVGVDAIVNGTRMTTGPSPAPAPSATYWDGPTSPGVDCDLPAQGVVADLGVSDVFAQSCGGFELTSLDALQIKDAHGAIQTMTFVVPQNSRFSEISAQAAYFVFGFGKDGGVLDAPGGAPIWNDESALHKRSATSGTQTMLGAAIGVPPASWKGTPHATSDDVAAAITSAGQSKDTADKALGILAADYIDSQNLRAQIRVLAFQDTSQRCAVFPDSTATSHDKQNVRDGHYPIWSPLHLLYKVDQFGNPLNQATRQLVLDIIGYLSGTKQLPNGVELIDVYAQSGLIPECAMRVSRTKDGGNIVPSRPEAPCSCLFEAKATGTASCKPCQVQGDCAGGETCSLGYCER